MLAIVQRDALSLEFELCDGTKGVPFSRANDACIVEIAECIHTTS